MTASTAAVATSKEFHRLPENTFLGRFTSTSENRIFPNPESFAAAAITIGNALPPILPFSLSQRNCSPSFGENLLGLSYLTAFERTAQFVRRRNGRTTENGLSLDGGGARKAIFNGIEKTEVGLGLYRHIVGPGRGLMVRIFAMSNTTIGTEKRAEPTWQGR
nr:hypothetical protein Itr_chr09CG08590 [Ipomoea trifida]